MFAVQKLSKYERYAQTKISSMNKAAYTYIRENGIKCHICLQISRDPTSVFQDSACRMCILCNRVYCCDHQKVVEGEYTIPYYNLEDGDTVKGDIFFVCEIDHEAHYNIYDGPGVYKSMSHWHNVKGEEIILAFMESRDADLLTAILNKKEYCNTHTEVEIDNKMI